MIGVARELAQVMKSYDVLFANSQKSLFVGALACAIARKPLVWILHDIITDPTFSKANRAAAVAVANGMTKTVVVNSKATAESFVESGGRKDLVRLVYNGFDVDRPTATPIDVRKEFGFDKRPVVGLFSRLSAWKGQHVLLDALKDAPDVQALLVGGALFGQEDYEASLRAQVETLGLGDRVRFAGFRDDVPRLMAGVDVVLHTSTHVEPFGRVVVEGMLAGKPVIATEGGGVGEIIDDGVTGLLIKPGDPGALAAAINRLTADPKLRKTLAAAGNASAKARFSLKHSCAQLQAMAQALAAGKAVPADG
jgi:glycosyltransferase involved in cell wall biosynthesis